MFGIPMFAIEGLIATSPFVILSLGAIVLMVLSTFVGPKFSPAAFTAVILIGALFALTRVILHSASLPEQVFGGMVALDRFSAIMTSLLLCGSLLTVCLGARSLKRQGIDSPAEFYVLFLIAVAAAILFCCATEMVTLFLALETMSMALYCMCGSALSRVESAESALKYFLLGSFSSAIMLYGIALLYGITGSLSFGGIAQGLANSDARMIINVAMGLTLIGLVFKVGSVPFHFWAPDVYQGAPTVVTAFMATVIKAAAVAALLRVLWTVFGSQIVFWGPAIWYASILSMLIGNFLALRQRSVKRMLAYSSVANAGYLLMGVLAPGDVAGGQQAIIFYLVGYTVMTLGSMGVVSVVSEGNKEHSDDIRYFNGLAERSPILAAVMALFLLALAGLPPGMVGLVGKIYLFSSAIRAEFVGLAIVGILASVVGCFYYLNVIVAMYFKPTDKAADVVTLNVGSSRAAVFAFCAIAIVVLGCAPSIVYDVGLAQQPAEVALLPE